jgi:methylisocitrate lyase
MFSNVSAGARLRAALAAERPLQLVGVINAFYALMAQSVGFRALYLSGAGVANASLGVPDLAITTLDDVLTDARRITAATDLSLLADIDTGWGTAFNIHRAIREMIRAGVAGVHIEDQVQAKRCGHRPNKQIVPADEMVDRITAAVAARNDPDFVIVARTDAFAREGLASALERARRYIAAGADVIFPEAMTELAHYRAFAEATGAPVLANLTEFGVTPLFTVQELAEAGVALAIYPLTIFRAMNAAALHAMQVLRAEGTQRALVGTMQTRDELYDLLDYHTYEDEIDRLFAQEQHHVG